MKRHLILTFLLSSLLSPFAAGQLPYEVEKAAFSSPRFDEFCPVEYMQKLIFCSNQPHELLITYQGTDNKSLFNIFQVDMDSMSTDNNVNIFSEALVTPFNDGPASFSPDGKTIVYVRNIDTETRTKNIFDMSNQLGLYFAEERNGNWVYTSDFPYNSLEYSISSPCFSPDGYYLYFASDMPGGFGGL